MIRYTAKQKYTIVFQFVVDGKVKESDMIGALITLTNAVHSDYNINKLQTSQKIGKISINIDLSQKEDRARGTIQIPSNLEPSENSILSAIIESIQKVGLFACKIALKEVVFQQNLNYQKVLRRAVEILKRYFTANEEETDLKQALIDLTTNNKAITVGNFTLGSAFYESSYIILVEGRKDVLKLAECGVHNTFALGGFNFEESKVLEYLDKKIVTLFLDGDRGGSEIEKKVLKALTIKYRIETPKDRSVEDLKKAEIFDLIKDRKLVI